MDLSFNEEQLRIAATARRILDARAGSASLRATLTSAAGYDADLWREISGQLGWTAILVPESHGGLGLGAVELAAVMEEMGRALLSAPFFSSVVLAEQVMLGVDEAQRSRYLPAFASGSVRAALAYAEPRGVSAWEGMQTRARREGDAFVLNGEKTFVVDGDTADTLVVAVDLNGDTALFILPSTLPGIERTRLLTLDPTRRQAAIRFHNVRVQADALLAAEAVARHALARGLDLAAVALAAEQVGGAQRCLDMALDYARTRQQFGRPIGSFQAIKHICADMLMHLETARSACYYAAAVAGTGEQDLSELAALTRVCCSEAYFFCAAQCIQIHGGIGFTWEHDAQLHFKRARSSMTLLGDVASHRERIAGRLLG